MIQRGQIYWISLGGDEGSRPAGHRPVLVIQADPYNESAWATVLVAVITSNLNLSSMPGNVSLPSGATGLPRDSVANLTALVTVNKVECAEVAGVVPAHLMHEIDRGLRLILAL